MFPHTHSLTWHLEHLSKYILIHLQYRNVDCLKAVLKYAHSNSTYNYEVNFRLGNVGLFTIGLQSLILSGSRIPNYTAKQLKCTQNTGGKMRPPGLNLLTLLIKCKGISREWEQKIFCSLNSVGSIFYFVRLCLKDVLNCLKRATFVPTVKAAPARYLYTNKWNILINNKKQPFNT